MSGEAVFQMRAAVSFFDVNRKCGRGFPQENKDVKPIMFHALQKNKIKFQAAASTSGSCWSQLHLAPAADSFAD
jgi:hypothetical protein